MSGPKNKNDTAWERLLNDLPVVQTVIQNGFFDITADEIKVYREPRLMCKIDFKESIPLPFQHANLSILAIVNGNYRISRTNPFIDVELSKLPKIPEKSFEIPKYLETLEASSITSESKALDAAKVSGMIDYLLATNELHLTIRGRLRSNQFDFTLPDINQQQINYPIDRVQIEVDGGYEGRNVLALIEAKMGDSNNMNIRQLLYPQLNFESIIKKPVVTYFMYYSVGGLFTFIPYLYNGRTSSFDYTNARLFRLIDNTVISPLTIYKTRIDPTLTGHGCPFPQADRLDKIIEVLFIIGDIQCGTKDEIFAGYTLVTRQWDYYCNALGWLGLACKDHADDCYKLTDDGIKAYTMPEKEMLFFLAQRVFSNEIFNAYLQTDNPHITDSIYIRNRLTPGSTTIYRRMQTVKAWRKYLFEVLDIT